MAIQFPDLTPTTCQMFRACGYLLSATKKHRDIVHAERPMNWMRARVRIGDSPHLVFACFGGPRKKPTNHVHIDVVRPDFYKKQPGELVPIARVKNVLTKLEGQPLGIKFEAHFLSQPDRLPRLVRATKFTTGSPNGMSIKTDSISFSVSNSPIDSISWFEDEEGGKVWTVVESHVRMLVSDVYLIRGFHLLAGTFDKFVMGSHANA